MALKQLDLGLEFDSSKESKPKVQSKRKGLITIRLPDIDDGLDEPCDVCGGIGCPQCGWGRG